MSNRRRKRQKQQKQVSGVGWEMTHIFFGVGTLPLSDDLIARLVHRGWRRVDLERFRNAGAVYSLQRNSIIFPYMLDE